MKHYHLFCTLGALFLATQNQLSVGLNIRSSLTADFKLTQYARFEPGAHILKAIKSLV